MTRALLLLLGACVLPPEDRPQSLVVCHNANCAAATDPASDDTLAALDASLALEYRGRPAFDGMEVDTLWDRGRSTCIFGHDFENAPDPREPALAAADRIAAHIRSAKQVSWRGDELFVKIQIKEPVTVAGDVHTADELAAHVACVYDMADRIVAAAIEANITLELGFDSDSVPYLRAVAAHPRWPGKTPHDRIALRLIGNIHAPGLRPDDLASLTAHAEDGIDTLAFHATATPTGIVDDYASLGVTLMLWMKDAAPETLSAMHRYEPRYVVTNEALLFRRWEEQ